MFLVPIFVYLFKGWVYFRTSELFLDVDQMLVCAISMTVYSKFASLLKKLGLNIGKLHFVVNKKY